MECASPELIHKCIPADSGDVEIADRRPTFHAWLGSVCLFLLLAAFQFGCHRAQTPARPLVVGMELEYPPFEMRDERGKPAGISVDLATELARSLDRPLVIENIPFAGLIPGLKTGRLDLVISSMTITEERRQSIDFSDPYWRSGLAIATYEGSGVRSAEDLLLPGKRAVVKLGTTGHIYAQQHLRDFVVVAHVGVACLEVVEHKCAAFLYDQLTILRTARSTAGFVPLLAPVQIENWGVGVAKGNEKLLESVNRFLSEARKQDMFKAIAEKHFGQDMEDARKWGGEFIY